MEKYVRINQEWFELGLSPTELLIYSIINSYTANGQAYYGGTKQLMNNLNVTKNTVLKSIKKLEQLGLVEREFIGKGLPFRFKAVGVLKNDIGVPKIDTPISKNGIPKIDTRVPKNDDRCTKNWYRGVPKFEPYNTNNKTIYKTNNNNDSCGDVFQSYLSNIGQLSPIEVDKLKDDIGTYSNEWVQEAIKVAVTNGKRSLSYVEGVLRNWKANGYKKERVKQNGSKRKDTIDSSRAKWERIAAEQQARANSATQAPSSNYSDEELPY